MIICAIIMIVIFITSLLCLQFIIIAIFIIMFIIVIVTIPRYVSIILFVFLSPMPILITHCILNMLHVLGINAMVFLHRFEHEGERHTLWPWNQRIHQQQFCRCGYPRAFLCSDLCRPRFLSLQAAVRGVSTCICICIWTFLSGLPCSSLPQIWLWTKKKVLASQIDADVWRVAAKVNTHQDDVDGTLWPTSTACFTAARFLTGYRSTLVTDFKALCNCSQCINIQNTAAYVRN